jgi:hypothetical protein
MRLIRSHMHSGSDPCSRNPHGATRRWQPAVQPTPNMWQRHRHYTARQWVGLMAYPQTSPEQLQTATTPLSGVIKRTTADRLACAHTPQAGSHAHHANTLQPRTTHWAWRTIKAEKRRATSHASAPRLQRPTQHSHHTCTCAIHSNQIAAVSRQ